MSALETKLAAVMRSDAKRVQSVIAVEIERVGPRLTGVPRRVPRAKRPTAITWDAGATRQISVYLNQPEYARLAEAASGFTLTHGPMARAIIEYALNHPEVMAAAKASFVPKPQFRSPL